jgi:hypothetical protein
MRSPPVTISPPFTRASATSASMAATRRVWASGPICVSGARPSPIFVPLMVATKRSAKRSYILPCTKKREGDTHTWPALRVLSFASMVAAASTFASSNTMAGEWPPSSQVPRFMCAPASAASCLPTGIEPVKDTLRTMGEAMR